MYLAGTSTAEIMETFPIANRRRVTEWVKAVREANTLEVLLPNQGRPHKNKEKQESIEAENERLKLENLYLKKLLDLKRG
ncbi:hypothetical protein [Metasolibacillus meyeri]|uniref:hypothetical protein n=1 Tax=Metasolibacillus meyeri TaxID=1071052 RepID=UPI00128FFE35|nr:hypothetical protein [Metasolibacillus meyeri]